MQIPCISDRSLWGNRQQMKNAENRWPGVCRLCLVAALMWLPATVSFAESSTPPASQSTVSQELQKYPGLLSELGQLVEKLKRNVQLPAPRNQTTLLPLLPASTAYYAAFPNYGDAVHQVLAIFHEELKQSDVLRDWWQHGEVSKSGPQLEAVLEKFSEISQYLGDEIVISGQSEPKTTDLIMIAHVRKPGLKEILQQSLQVLPSDSTSHFQVISPAELDDPQMFASPIEIAVLVRPDFVVAGNVGGLRRFNRLLDTRTGDFASAPFGEQVEQTYRGGTTAVAAVDLQGVLDQLSMMTPNRSTLEQSGIDNVKYFVWDHTRIADQSLSRTELSFVGPRHGIASWLAGPSALGGLDFVSPKSPLVLAFALKNLGAIFDDIKGFSSRSNPAAFAALPAIEQTAHLSLRDDVFAQFQGEATFVLTKIGDPQPEWNAIFRVIDQDHLQKSLDVLLHTLHFQPRQFQEQGVVYRSFLVPSQPKPAQIVYAITGNYLIAASNQQSVAQAIERHKSGQSLAKSTALLSSVPAGYSPESSFLFYEDGSAISAGRLRQLSPELADALSQTPRNSPPVVYRAYGEPDAIRGVSVSPGIDASAVLVGAAIAIPNLLRVRIAANESSAVAALRLINTAQITYSAAYMQRGYANDLASLGTNRKDFHQYSPSHAGFLDETLGNSRCTTGVWCTKHGYQFSLRATCREQECKEYVVVATPLSRATGTRNFCSTSDAVVRSEQGPPLTAPITAAECKAWTPMR
jgi:type IV pilus assembly protein PilA